MVEEKTTWNEGLFQTGMVEGRNTNVHESSHLE